MSKSGFRRHDDHSADDNEVDMTPMIDCIMLLLIFFMTTSKMNAQGAVPVPEARNGSEADPRKSIMISIFEPKSAGKEAEVVLGDGYPDDSQRPIAKNDDEIRTYLKNARERDLKNQVVIKAEDRVPARDVHRISKIVGEFDTMSLYLGIRNREGGG
jgi:biopolymer transport protein ExbD